MGINLQHNAGSKVLMGDHGRMHRPDSDVAIDVAAESGDVAAGSGDAPQPHFQRRVTSFRARRSAISDSQQATWERLWPQLGGQVRADDPHSPAPGLLDTDAWFGRHAPVILEIGCGTGTSTLAMAQAEPKLDVVAVEVYRRGLAQLLSAIDRTSGTAHPVTNIRLLRGDGVDVLSHMFGPGSLTGVRVFFPDPWPKARHHKRRLLQPDTVAMIADRLRPGGLLHAATDHLGYAAHIAEVGDAEPRLRRVSADSEGLAMSVSRPETKYERKALAGTDVSEMLWERTS